MKKHYIFLTFFSSFFSLLSCYKPIPKENTGEIKEPIKEETIISNEPIITESEPLSFSNEYHEGFYMRKRSSFYPYEPIVKQTKEELEDNITIPVLNVNVEGTFTSNGTKIESKKI